MLSYQVVHNVIKRSSSSYQVIVSSLLSYFISALVSGILTTIVWFIIQDGPSSHVEDNSLRQVLNHYASYEKQKISFWFWGFQSCQLLINWTILVVSLVCSRSILFVIMSQFINVPIGALISINYDGNSFNVFPSVSCITLSVAVLWFGILRCSKSHFSNRAVQVI